MSRPALLYGPLNVPMLWPARHSQNYSTMDHLLCYIGQSNNYVFHYLGLYFVFKRLFELVVVFVAEFHYYCSTSFM